MTIIWDSKRNWTILFLLMVISLMVYFQLRKLPSGTGKRHVTVKRDMNKIIESGELRAITGYNSTSYFIYKGRPMGYDYDLLVDLADKLGLDLKIILSNDLDEQMDLLNSGKGDIIAYNLTITKKRRDKMSFTDALSEVEQVLVQRKPENWQNKTLEQIEDGLIRNPIDLIGKRVYVNNTTAYYDRLLNLSNEIGGDIEIGYVEQNTSTEDLIRMVSEGIIEYTVADKNVALLNGTYYQNIDVNTAISFPQRIAWAVRKNSPELLDTINHWISVSRRSGFIRTVYDKYYKNQKAYVRRLNSHYYSHTGGGISEYDPLFKKYAEEIGWDWRLLAAQSYHESKFDPNAISWAGAVGIMQLIPATAMRYIDSTEITDPEKNIKAAVRYLAYLNDFWDDIDNKEERIKFILASYNVGEGHVMDAVRLCEKYGCKTNKWTDEVEEYIKLKSNPNYYRDEVVRYGYSRGQQTYNYVRDVMNTYELYTHFIE